MTVFLTLGLAACTAYPVAPNAGFDLVIDAQSELSTTSSVGSGSSAHSVSLRALMEKQFDGRDLSVREVLDRNDAYTRYSITYKSGGLTISGIMNVPQGEGPFPVLILNHGFIEPSVYTNGRGLKREQDYLARRGYAVLHSDYRNHAFSDKDEGNDVRMRLGYVEDAINAVYAVRASDDPRLDGTRVGMLGHSMGGGVTLNVLVVQPDLVSAAVLFAPVHLDARKNFERWITRRPKVANAIRETYGAPEENPEFWDGVSAATHVDRIKAPVLLHHGTADKDVPYAWGEETAGALRDAKKRHHLSFVRRAAPRVHVGMVNRDGAHRYIL